MDKAAAYYSEKMREAYYRGRNDVWAGEKSSKCPYTNAELVQEYEAGRRHAKAEIRLNEDTEWD